MQERRQRQVDGNYEAFKKLLPELLLLKAGKSALLRNGELIEVFDNMADAERTGRLLYNDGLFSVQLIDQGWVFRCGL